MKEKFVNSSINLIQKYQDCDDLKLKKLNYGLQGIYSLLIKLTTVMIIAIIFKTIRQTMLFLLFYSGIRTFSYGLHSKSNIGCWITTITFYNIIPFFIRDIEMPTMISYIVLGIAFMSILLWSPADTQKKPLIREKQRLKCKILSMIIVILYTTIIIFNNNNLIQNAITYALVLQCLFINPMTYKLTKNTFNNYKHYNKN